MVAFRCSVGLVGALARGTAACHLHRVAARIYAEWTSTGVATADDITIIRSLLIVLFVGLLVYLFDDTSCATAKNRMLCSHLPVESALEKLYGARNPISVVAHRCGREAFSDKELH